MTQPRFRRTQPRLIFIHCLYLAKLIPVLRIGAIAQMVERQNDDLEIAEECWFEPAQLFFSQQCSLVCIRLYWRIPTVRMIEA